MPKPRFGVTVKVAVRLSPVPPIAPSVPPSSVTSASSKLLPGSSLKAKVISAASLTRVLLLVMLSVGATMSILITGVVAAAPRLPAASV